MLTPDALARNRVQTSYHVRPFQGLPTTLPNDGKEAKCLKALPNPHPDQTFILSLQDIQRRLFILNAYSKTVDARNELLELWGKFDGFQASTTMDADGNIKSDKAIAMGEFEEDLQKRILDAEKLLRSM